jgi:hypothetical protein
MWHSLERSGVLSIQQEVWRESQRFAIPPHLTFRIDGIAKSDYLSLMAVGFYNSANRIGLPNIFRKQELACFNAREHPLKSASSNYLGIFLGALNEESRRCFRVGRCHRHCMLSACCAGVG